MEICRPYKTVQTWNSTPVDISSPAMSALWQAFSTGTIVFTQDDINHYFFDDIWMPFKIPDINGMPDEFTYLNMGIGIGELVYIYETLYGKNLLVEPLIKYADESSDYVTATNKLARRIKSVLEINKAKYLKLIELAGYSYNPLWNVDGTDTYSYLENDGTITDARTVVNANYKDTTKNNVTKDDTDNNVTSFDSNTPNLDTQSKHTATSDGEIDHGAHTDTDTNVRSHTNAKNNGVDYAGGTDAFGNTVIGGDKYHTENRIRRGNIGVTKTQELIASERENLRFNVINEFFDDLNKQILIGIFD